MRPRPTLAQLAARRELLVATAALQRMQLRYAMRRGPWQPVAARALLAWRLWHLVRRWWRRR